MRLKSRMVILCGCMWIIFVLGVGSFSVAAQVSSDIQERINGISEAVKNSVHETYQGIGTARVSIYTEAVSPGEGIIDPATKIVTAIKPQGKVLEKRTEEFLVDFVFLGDSSRADCYKIDNGQRGNRILNSINTPEQDIIYNEDFVVLKAPHTNQYYRLIGYDFHPETLVSLSGGKLFMTEEINRYFKYLREIKLDSTKDGLFRLSGNGEKQDKEAINTVNLILDPKTIFRPIRCNYVYKNERLGVDFTSNYQAEWKQYSSIWYLSHLSYEEIDKPKNRPPSKYRVEIQILSFDPLTVVNDSKFKLENLNVPSGTTINDRR